MEEVLALLRSNNIMLQQILEILQKEQNEDFMVNVVANMVADKMMGK